MKKIIVLNGSPRTGNTAELIKSFAQGAESVGHKVSIFAYTNVISKEQAVWILHSYMLTLRPIFPD